MTDHERARELYWKIFQRKFYPSDPQDETDAAIERITDALQAQRRAVWEEAATHNHPRMYWVCGCGWTSGANLAQCARCGRTVTEGNGISLEDDLRNCIRAKAKELEP